MNDAPQYTSLRDYLRVLREQRLLILGIAILFTGVSIVLSARVDPTYEAAASLSFRSEAEDLSDVGGGGPITETPEQRAAIAAERIASLDVAERTSSRLKPRISPAAILSNVRVQPAARTNFVVIQTTAGTAQAAADMANAFARSAREIITRAVRKDYAARADTLERTNRRLPKSAPETGYTRVANVDRIQRLRNLARLATPVVLAVAARPPGSPESPKPVRNAILGLIAGLTFALLLAFGRDALDRRFKSAREIKDDLHLPLLGHVRDEMLGRTINGNAKNALNAEELEAFRILRTNVDFLDIDRSSPSIVVTSALAEEGKSTVSVALAGAYASAGKRVLLVECDLRRPTLADRMGLAASPGMTDYLIGDARPEDILQTVEIGGQSPRSDGDAPSPSTLVCITAGTLSPQPTELLGSQRFAEFIGAVSEVYDAVIIDSCPLLPVADTLAIVPHVGRIVMCVRASRTTRDQARAAAAALQHFPDRPTGIVVTGLRTGDETEYGYYSYAYTSA